MDYKRLIETGFDIIDKKGSRGAFILNPIQDKYLEVMKADNPNMEGLRENVLKARQQGFSAFIDAIFIVDFLSRQNIGAQIISHKEKETETLMNRANFFLDSFLEKNNLKRTDILKQDRRDYLENKVNGSYIFIGTAGAKTLGRGGTLQNIHWSEVAFYPDTEVMSAEKLVTGAEQQVPMGVGKVFRETTGNMQGDFFFREKERSRKDESSFKYRFFPWFDNKEYMATPPQEYVPTEGEKALMTRHNLNLEQVYWYHLKMKEFETKALGLREYPSTEDEAFLASGAAFFDPDVLKGYYDLTKEPINKGFLAMDGAWM